MKSFANKALRTLRIFANSAIKMLVFKVLLICTLWFIHSTMMLISLTSMRMQGCANFFLPYEVISFSRLFVSHYQFVIFFCWDGQSPGRAKKVNFDYPII